VSRMTSSPYFVHRLAEHVLQTKQTLPLRKIFTGGAPVFPREAALLAEAFTDANIQIVYGSTEAEPISTISAHELKHQAGQALQGLDVGMPYRKTEVIILPITDAPMTAASEEELKDISLPPNQAGEIVVSGPHVLREYLHNPEALKRNKIFIGEKVWHRTGDAGYRDETGRLFLCGRCSTMIAKKDGWIFPFLVEEQIAGLKGYSMGTVLEVNGKILLIAETNALEKDQQGLLALAASRGVEKNNVQEISSVPRDPRHHSKIDYEKLRLQLRSR
jgi:acyl-CoA synthetase (AMP-forming)/AMP-acid ligase II